MKNLIACFLLLVQTSLFAQTFTNNTDVSIFDVSISTADITVSGVPTPLSCPDNSLISVCLSITHTWDSDLSISLVHIASATTIDLSLNNGGSDDNYSITCFVPNATPITSGIPPFNGNFLPEEPLGTFNGLNPNGTWQLIIADGAFGDIGVLDFWSMTFGPCPPMPPGTTQDCSGALQICSDQSFSNNSNGTGNFIDLTLSNQGCLGLGERQGTWYYFSPATPGTIGFTISPLVATDYDFAVWGPMASIQCPPVGPPLRCSFAAPNGDTGAGNGATDFTEGAGGDRWVSTFNVLPGEFYLLYIDNFSINGQAFNLSWQLTNGATLDCSILPIELIEFSGNFENTGNVLRWSTASETDNDYFTLRRSEDLIEWEFVANVASIGNSQSETNYSYLDKKFEPVLNYYRLEQTDLNGTHQNLKVIAIDNSKMDNPILRKINYLGQDVDESYKGFVIEYRAFGKPTSKLQ